MFLNGTSDVQMRVNWCAYRYRHPTAHARSPLSERCLFGFVVEGVTDTVHGADQGLLIGRIYLSTNSIYMFAHNFRRRFAV